MTREEYLRELQTGLEERLTKEETADIVAEYAGFFESGREEGRSEEDVASALGSPAGLVRMLAGEKAGQGPAFPVSPPAAPVVSSPIAAASPASVFPPRASFGRRVGAYLIDRLAVFLIVALLIAAAVWLSSPGTDTGTGGAASQIQAHLDDGSAVRAEAPMVIAFGPLLLLLSILEDVGYMARVAFIMDRIFRRFGLSGKSFIPMLVGTGCGVPGIMASRTIENERDRRMTIMTTTFIPCGAKVPFIAMVAGAIFGGAAWVATSAYFVGMAAIIISGIMLKKTKMFAGDPAPFVMELPAYHWPTVGNVLRSMWERGWSFIKKAGTIILLSTIAVWFTTYFGWAEDGFRMLSEEEIDCSILAHIGSLIAWIFAPLGWGNWKAAVASITGLVAKENIVGTLGILYGGGDETVYQALGTVFTQISGYSFLVFNLLCAPCFAAIGAIKREMNNAKWTWFAIGYQCGFAYLCALMVNQFGKAFTGDLSVLGLVAALAALAFILYMLVRPYKEATKLSAKV